MHRTQEEWGGGKRERWGQVSHIVNCLSQGHGIGNCLHVCFRQEYNHSCLQYTRARQEMRWNSLCYFSSCYSVSSFFTYRIPTSGKTLRKRDFKFDISGEYSCPFSHSWRPNCSVQMYCFFLWRSSASYLECLTERFVQIYWSLCLQLDLTLWLFKHYILFLPFQTRDIPLQYMYIHTHTHTCRHTHTHQLTVCCMHTRTHTGTHRTACGWLPWSIQPSIIMYLCVCPVQQSFRLTSGLTSDLSLRSVQPWQDLFCYDTHMVIDTRPERGCGVTLLYEISRNHSFEMFSSLNKTSD